MGGSRDRPPTRWAQPQSAGSLATNVLSTTCRDQTAKLHYARGGRQVRVCLRRGQSVYPSPNGILGAREANRVEVIPRRTADVCLPGASLPTRP